MPVRKAAVTAGLTATVQRLRVGLILFFAVGAGCILVSGCAYFNTYYKIVEDVVDT